MAISWLATRGLMGYGAYEVDKNVFNGWTWNKLKSTVKDIGTSILSDDKSPDTNANANADADVNASTNPDTTTSSGDTTDVAEEESTLDKLKDTASTARDQIASGNYLGALSTVAGATQGDDAPEDEKKDSGFWSFLKTTAGVAAGGYAAKKVLWDWTLGNLFGGKDDNNNNDGGNWFGKLLSAGVVIGALVAAAMNWRELKGMATSAFNKVVGDDKTPSAEATNTNSSVYDSSQIDAYFKNNPANNQTSVNTSASMFGSALGGAASSQINQPNPSEVNIDTDTLERVSTSQVSGSFANQISANDGIDADKFASNGSKPVIFNTMANGASDKPTSTSKIGNRAVGSDVNTTLDAE